MALILSILSPLCSANAQISSGVLPRREFKDVLCRLDIHFPSNHNINKSLCGLCFWASDPLIERF